MNKLQVRVLQLPKSAMQSGRGRCKDWLIQPVCPTARRPEALMGWIAAEDTVSALMNRLRFDSADKAKAFAEKQGWSVMIEPTETRRVIPRSYLDNFRIVRPQDEQI